MHVCIDREGRGRKPPRFPLPLRRVIGALQRLSKTFVPPRGPAGRVRGAVWIVNEASSQATDGRGGAGQGPAHHCVS